MVRNSISIGTKCKYMDTILGVYIFIASTAPVWILLQPRDYLNSFLLYAMMGGAVLGLLYIDQKFN